MPIDVVYNLTRFCNWDCRDCCINSIKSSATDLKKTDLQASGKELVKSDKLTIIKDLADNNCNIDFSGGNPLLYKEDMEIIEYAAQLMPCKKISASIAGINLTEDRINTLKAVGKIHITLDGIPYDIKNSRPTGFNELAVKTIEKCLDLGKDVRVVTVLKRNPNLSSLAKIHDYLCEIGVKEWQLLRFYPVGRAINKWSETIEVEQHQSIINFLKTLRGRTQIKFQHSFKGGFEKIECPAVTESIGILPDGRVIACPWGLDSNGEPIDKRFELGKAPEQKIKDILSSERAYNWKKKGNVCKTFEFLSLIYPTIEKNLQLKRIGVEAAIV